MKESILGPRQWAFVVIAGGTLCSLPFIQSDPSASPTESAVKLDLAAANAANLFDDAKLPVALPSQEFPEWVGVNRSPFDELVATAPPQPNEPPADLVPLQPLRPWISSPQIPTTTALKVVDDDVAKLSSVDRQPSSSDPRPRRETVASPWSQLPSAPASGMVPISSTIAQNEPVWPDQLDLPDRSLALKEDEVKTHPRSRYDGLASAVVTPPGGAGGLTAPLGPNALGPNALAPSASLSSASLSQASLSGGRIVSPAPPPYLPPRPETATVNSWSQNSVVAQELAKLPEARKKNIIFQPNNRASPPQLP